MINVNSEMLAECTNCGHIGTMPPITITNPPGHPEPTIDSVEFKEPVLLVCSACGQRTSVVQPGKYSYNMKTHRSRLITGPPETYNAIQRIKNLLEVLEGEQLPKEQVIAKLESISPALAQLSQQLAPTTNYKEWAGLIMTLLSLLISIQQGYFKKDTDSDIKREYINHLLKENEEMKRKAAIRLQLSRTNLKLSNTVSTTKVQPPAKAAPELKATSKSKRNSLCYCGSGKKTKKCHGIR